MKNVKPGTWHACFKTYLGLYAGSNLGQQCSWVDTTHVHLNTHINKPFLKKMSLHVQKCVIHAYTRSEAHTFKA